MAKYISDWRLGHLEARSRALGEAKALIDTQADDETLWFDAETAPEAHVMAALRALHQAVEDAHNA